MPPMENRMQYAPAPRIVAILALRDTADGARNGAPALRHAGAPRCRGHFGRRLGCTGRRDGDPDPGSAIAAALRFPLPDAF